MRWLAIRIVGVIVACGSSARADELDDMYIEAHGLTRPAPRPLRDDQIWYGWQTLTADAAFISVWALYPKWSGFTGDGAVLLLDMIGYSVVSPVIDALHDNIREASIAIRLTLPLVGSLVGLGIGASVPGCGSSILFCSNVDVMADGAFYGALFGAGLAALIDGVAFSWATRKSSASTASWHLAPIGVRAGGGIGATYVF